MYNNYVDRDQSTTTKLPVPVELFHNCIVALEMYIQCWSWSHQAHVLGLHGPQAHFSKPLVLVVALVFKSLDLYMRVLENVKDTVTAPSALS